MGWTTRRRREVQWVRSKSRSHRYPDILTSDNLVRILVRRSCTKVTYWIYRYLLFHWTTGQVKSQKQEFARGNLEVGSCTLHQSIRKPPSFLHFDLSSCPIKP